MCVKNNYFNSFSPPHTPAGPGLLPDGLSWPIHSVLDLGSQGTQAELLRLGPGLAGEPFTFREHLGSFKLSPDLVPNLSQVRGVLHQGRDTHTPSRGG